MKDEAAEIPVDRSSSEGARTKRDRAARNSSPNPSSADSLKAKSSPKERVQKKQTREERLLQKLEFRRLEVEMQNEELRAAQLIIEESRQKYSDLYDFAPIGYFTFDHLGVIEEANLTGASLLGMDRRWLIRKPFILYVAKEDHDLFRAHRMTVLKSGRRQSCEIRLVRKVEELTERKRKNKVFYAQLESILVEDPNQQRWVRTALSDISSRKEAEEKLVETHQTLEAVFKASPLAIYILDPEGRVKSWNPSAQRIFGWREQEVIGRPFPAVPAERQEEFLDLLRKVLQGERFTGLELQRKKKSGEPIDIAISTAVLRDKVGNISGAMAVAEDITERKRAAGEIQTINEELRRKNAQIQEAAQARNRFFSYISHELKTPLNSIVGFTQLMRNETYGQVTQEQAKTLARIQSNAGVLVQLINNILDLAKIESGKITPRIMEVNLVELAEKTAMPFEPFLREKGLQLRTKIAPSFPKSFRTDPSKFRSILTNLLSNAIRFTDKGEIQILLDSLPVDSGIQITVSDNGIGIKPDDFKKLFKHFQETEGVRESPASYTEGTRLGLAIVKRMTTALHGKINVESVVGQGTRFTLVFPSVK